MGVSFSVVKSEKVTPILHSSFYGFFILSNTCSATIC